MTFEQHILFSLIILFQQNKSSTLKDVILTSFPKLLPITLYIQGTKIQDGKVSISFNLSYIKFQLIN